MIAGTPTITRAAARDRAELADVLNAIVPDSWPEELMADTLDWTANRLEEHPDETGWWVWYWIRTDSPDGRIVVGNGGFKGPPDDHGIVEVGYAVQPEFRRQGLAVEATAGLIRWAFDHPQVQRVDAESLPHLTPSFGVMKRLDMKHLGTGSSEGTVRYGITRAEYA